MLIEELTRREMKKTLACRTAFLEKVLKFIDESKTEYEYLESDCVGGFENTWIEQLNSAVRYHVTTDLKEFAKSQAEIALLLIIDKLYEDLKCETQTIATNRT